MLTRPAGQTARLVSDGGDECFLTVRVPRASSFQAALASLREQYVGLRNECGLDENSEIWVRFFLSDIQNQAGLLREQWRASPTALLCPIGQPPLDSRYVSLLAYHIKAGSLSKQGSTAGALRFAHGGYTSFLHTVLPEGPADAKEQTDGVILRLQAELARHNLALEKHVLRTWYYMRDIDNNYAGMVQSRRKHYEAHGLTPETRFIASTGIEASAPAPWALSWLISMATQGLSPEQVTYLHALEHLSPTHVYGVNFERATRVTYGDRAHIHLSGTASIDKHGHVVFPGDVERQMGRTWENIEAIFAEGGMAARDLQYAIVYLRDAEEYTRLAPGLDEKLGNIPHVVVRGPVCRPEWLIEIEGLGGVAARQERFAVYC